MLETNNPRRLQEERCNVLTPECISESLVVTLSSSLGLGDGMAVVRGLGPRGLGTSRERLQDRMTQDRSGRLRSMAWLRIDSAGHMGETFSQLQGQLAMALNDGKGSRT